MFQATVRCHALSGVAVRVPVASILLAASLITACGHPTSSPGATPVPGIARSWPYLGLAANVNRGPQAMVVSGSPIASQVGRDVLRRGGNAVDAAVAVGFALAVVHPEAGNLGGGGFMIIRNQDGRVHALDYRERAPARATRDMYRSAAQDANVTGHVSAGVTGG